MPNLNKNYRKIHSVLSARQEKSAVKQGRGKGVILLRMRTPLIPIPNTLYSVVSASAVHCENK
jgi:hypothetical protein